MTTTTAHRRGIATPGAVLAKARAGAAGLLGAVCLALAFGCGTSPQSVTEEAAMEIEEGKPFPPLVLPSLADGRPLSIRDFQGAPVLLHIFASW